MVLHSLEPTKLSQASPPYCGCCVTRRVLVCQPPPQAAEQLEEPAPNAGPAAEEFKDLKAAVEESAAEGEPATTEEPAVEESAAEEEPAAAHLFHGAT